MEDLNAEFFSYKGKPLVRKGNTVYFGSMLDEYVVMLQILNTKKEGNEELPNDIVVQLMRTDKSVKPQDVIVKKSEKNGMSAAMEIADIWLTRALSDQQ